MVAFTTASARQFMKTDWYCTIHTGKLKLLNSPFGSHGLHAISAASRYGLCVLTVAGGVVIYSCGKYFACRICANVAYQAQNETWQDRLFTKANKLRKRIGAEPAAFNPLPYSKPKGMHQKTWNRIRWQIIILEDRGFAGLEKYL